MLWSTASTGPHCPSCRHDRSVLTLLVSGQLLHLGLAAVELYDDLTSGRRQEEGTGGGVSPVFVGVVSESCLVCSPGFTDVDPVIAGLSGPDFACWKGGRHCENPTC